MIKDSHGGLIRAMQSLAFFFPPVACVGVAVTAIQKKRKIYLLTLIDYCYWCPWVLVAQKPASMFHFQSDRCQIPHGSETDGEIRERFEREKMCT